MVQIETYVGFKARDRALGALSSTTSRGAKLDVISAALQDKRLEVAYRETAEPGTTQPHTHHATLYGWVPAAPKPEPLALIALPPGAPVRIRSLYHRTAETVAWLQDRLDNLLPNLARPPVWDDGGPTLRADQVAPGDVIRWATGAASFTVTEVSATRPDSWPSSKAVVPDPSLLYISAFGPESARRGWCGAPETPILAGRL